jgi:hypothetical protein
MLYCVYLEEIPRDKSYITMITLISKEFEVCKRMGVTRYRHSSFFIFHKLKRSDVILMLSLFELNCFLIICHFYSFLSLIFFH